MLLLHLNTYKWYHLYVFSELFTVWCLYLDNKKPLLHLSPLSFFFLKTLKNMLPEVGDLQRSSDVAEPSLMSHRPAVEIIQINS